MRNLNLNLSSFLGLFIFLASSIHCKDEFIISYSPRSISFTTMEPIHSSSLADLFSSMLSYSVQNPVTYLNPVNPLKRPQALIIMDFNGFNDASLELLANDGDHFDLENSGDIDQQFNILAGRTERRFAENSLVLLKVPTSEDLFNEKYLYPNLLQSLNPESRERFIRAIKDSTLNKLIKDGTFNVSINADKQFLTEIMTTKMFIDIISKHRDHLADTIPDIFWLNYASIGDLVRTHGANSLQVKEAIRLFNQAILNMEANIRKTYSDQAVLTVITQSAEATHVHSRRKREAHGNAYDVLGKANVAQEWSEDFHVAFIMILFVSLLLILAVFGISMGMLNMDPARDSIIYRMTGQRQKRD